MMNDDPGAIVEISWENTRFTLRKALREDLVFNMTASSFNTGVSIRMPSERDGKISKSEKKIWNSGSCVQDYVKIFDAERAVGGPWLSMR